MHAEVEDVLNKAKEYAESQKDAKSEKEQFREEMRRQRERQEQEAKDKYQTKQDQGHKNSSSSSSGSTRSNTKSKNHTSSRSNHAQKSQPNPETEKDNRTPREVLGLGAEFTQVELKKVRNEALKRCHSDKWANKPKAVQQVMEEETKRINWAYERLKG